MTSDLTLDLAPDAVSVVAQNPHVPVHASSRPLGAKESTAVAECRLCVGDVVIGGATVRSFYIEAPATNATCVIHGGVASTGLEVVAAAAVNHGRTDVALTTASLRVNFLRPFLASAGSAMRQRAGALAVAAG